MSNKLLAIGCSHHKTAVATRERLAFSTSQVPEALSQLKSRFPAIESVLLSTCNRTELYLATQTGELPPAGEVVAEWGRLRALPVDDFQDDLYIHNDLEVAEHLFTVTSSLDSMVLGEPQISGQVKQAYEVAIEKKTAGPLTHCLFQVAMRTAKRIARETQLYQRRISLPSVAITEFACQIFERFDDKEVLILGVGEMAHETVLYLKERGACHFTVVNRSDLRGEEFAKQYGAKVASWKDRYTQLAQADLLICATGASTPVLTLDDYKQIEVERAQKPLFMLDLSIPRNIDYEIGNQLGVYLYSIDDLQAVCESNKERRGEELPLAHKIIQSELTLFQAESGHLTAGAAISQLQEMAQQIKENEFRRLKNKLSDISEKQEREIRYTIDRVVNKVLAPPLESLREEAKEPATFGRLLGTFRRLFNLSD